ALWILVANGWMQNPVGMRFNPETARNEMMNFWEVFLSPVAINKFLHTISSGFVLASIFVIGISCWFLNKNREIILAKRSIIIAATFGILTSLFNIITGDGSASIIARVQPMKFAAIEGLYEGKNNAGLIAFGIPKSEKKIDDNTKTLVKYKIEIPNLLSYLAFGNAKAFVPGIKDLTEGNENKKIISVNEKIERGKIAKQTLREYKDAKEKGFSETADSLALKFQNEEFIKNYFRYFGYAFLNNPKSIIPNVPITFYSFHLMVILGFYFLIFLIAIMFLTYNNTIQNIRWLLKLAIFTIPLPYIATMAGWAVAEVGRQPWVIQDLLPTVVAVSKLNASAVQLTFWLFAILFTALLLAELKIMIKQIKTGPK
ncbi:MAG: cytochrome ubiquinol oxidase subunit I, partial [Bacteroidales bacterium]|nr:cytochrome ubiquinol oxidase subunit I [Bacteroidales bacterium]